MRQVLDGMQEMMEGTGVFDGELFSDLVECFDKFDPQLMAAQDAEWAGMAQFAAMGGTEEDEWASCQVVDNDGLVSLILIYTGLLYL